jgi:hypothetical protein
MKNIQNRIINYVFYYLCLLAISLISSGLFSDQGSRPSIVSFMPDFYIFWEKAKDKPLDEKMRLWDEQFENKYSDFYKEIIYAAENEEQLSNIKSERLKKFFVYLEDSHVENMKTKEKELKEHIPEVLEELRKYFPDIKDDTPQYIIPSLFTSSGAVRPYKGAMVVYFGLEIISRMDSPAEVKANVFHETFHAYHFKNIMPFLVNKYGENQVGGLHQEGPLLFAFLEGLTVLATEKTYSGIPRPGIVERFVPDYEDNFYLYLEEFLKDLENYNQQKFYQRYFWDPSDDPFIPDKFGYWLGYKIALSLNKEFSIQEMANWDPDKAKQKFSQKINETALWHDSST